MQTITRTVKIRRVVPEETVNIVAEMVRDDMAKVISGLADYEVSTGYMTTVVEFELKVSTAANPEYVNSVLAIAEEKVREGVHALS